VRRFFSLIAVAFSLLAGTFSVAFAQDTASPTANNGQQTPGVVYNSDGTEEAQVSTTSIVDPFQDFDPSSAPQRGFHFVLVDVSVTATGDHDVDVSSSGFQLVDTDGFSYYQSYVYRTEAATTADPDFAGGTLTAGDTMTGAIAFQVLDGTHPALLDYQPSYDRLVTAGDWRESAVAPGDAVETIASDGTPWVTITVGDVVDPVKDFDPSSPPQRGFEYIGVNVTIENTSNAAQEVDAYNFNFVDEEGFLTTSYGAYRTTEGEAAMPSLQSSNQLDPGASVTGLLTFQVLAGTKPGLLFFAPTSDRHIRVAEWNASASNATPTAGKTPAVPPVNSNRTPTAEATDEATQTADFGDIDCGDVLSWAKASVPGLTTWGDEVSAVGTVLQGAKVNSADIRTSADKISNLADDQENIDVPQGVEDLNGLVVQAYRDTVDSLNKLADAVDANDTPALLQSAQDILEISGRFQTGEIGNQLNALGTACPALQGL